MNCAGGPHNELWKQSHTRISAGVVVADTSLLVATFAIKCGQVGEETISEHVSAAQWQWR